MRSRESYGQRKLRIGNLAIKRLKKLDAMAYLLFASVYRDFRSLEDFAQELAKLQEDEVNKYD